MTVRPGLNVVFIVCFALFGTDVGPVFAKGSSADFGVNEDELKARIVSSLAQGAVLMYPDRKLFKAASASERATFVKNILISVKAYTESAAFKADYNKQRESSKPQPPTSKGTPDAQFATFIKEQRDGLEKMKKDVSTMSPEMQKQMTSTIKQYEANVEKMTNDPQMAAIMKQSYEQARGSDQKNYQNQRAEWETKYPLDPRVLIASRLHQFLELTQDIAFDAPLVPNGHGTMKFADPHYEAKSSQWKQCYRIGKEPIQAARDFAVEWLRQIEKK